VVSTEGSQKAPPAVRLENVTKEFKGMVAVDDLTLELAQGEFFALLGPSGCGKTTTLRMVGGFEQPSSGKIFLGGVDAALSTRRQYGLPVLRALSAPQRVRQRRLRLAAQGQGQG
jgi:ABC-type Fe3+/spermidine/putrescine transport system ATPase subunit